MKILIINFWTTPNTGLDIYAKQWKNIYGEDCDYINLKSIDKIESVSGLYLFLSLLLGIEKTRIQFIQKLLEDNNYQFIHITDSTLFSYLFLKQCNDLNIKTVMTLHDPIPHIEKTIYKKIKRLFLVYLNKKIYNLVRKSKKLFLHVHSKKIIPSTWKLDDLLIQAHPLVNVTNVNDLFSLSKKNKIVFSFLGRLEYYKGIQLYIEAINELYNLLSMKDIDDVAFLVAGKGNIDFLNNEVDQSKIIFINKFLSEEEFDSIILYSDIIVLPYLEATQSGVLSKAIDAEKVTIVTNVGALSDYVVEGETGYVVNASVKSLVDKMLYLIKSENEIKRLQSNVVNVKALFEVEKIKNSFISKISKGKDNL